MLSPYNEFSTNNPSYSFFVRSNNVILQLFKHRQTAQLRGVAIGSARIYHGMQMLFNDYVMVQNCAIGNNRNRAMIVQ